MSRRPLGPRARVLAALAAAALALPAGAAAQAPAPAGTSASVEVLTGGDYTLEIWSDASTGEIALIDTRQPEDEQVALVRGTGLILFDGGNDPEVFDWRYRSRAELSDAIRALWGIDLDGVEAALAAGAPAPRPEGVSLVLAIELARSNGEVQVAEHFGPAARQLARRAGRPVAWAGPRRLGFRVRQTSLVSIPFGGSTSPVAYVLYGRGRIPFTAFCDACFGVASAPVGTPTAREFTGGRAFTRRIAGRPALDSPISGSVAVRLGPLVVLLEDKIGERRLRKLVRSLRIIEA
jgi:hypothetical protein